MMSNAAFIGLSYGISAAVLATYALTVLRRGRRLSREVPEERRRWMGPRPIPPRAT